jgi:hypothetical protein
MQPAPQQDDSSKKTTNILMLLLEKYQKITWNLNKLIIYIFYEHPTARIAGKCKNDNNDWESAKRPPPSFWVALLAMNFSSEIGEARVCERSFHRHFSNHQKIIRKLFTAE